MKKYLTNFSRGCFDHWTASHAISEMVSNYLDSEGKQSYSIGEDTLTLHNEGVVVSNKMLMMGLSDKRGDDTKRGQFGVGAVQCLVVLTDLGINIAIENGGVYWKPKFEHSEAFDEDIMVIEEIPLKYNTGSFCVTITGLSAMDIDEVKQRCLHFQKREVLHSTEIGTIIDGEEGEIFVGDMFVTQSSDFKHSYNFNPKVVPLNQDRNVVDNWELRKLTAKMLSMVDDEGFVTDTILANKSDASLINDKFYTGKSPTDDSHSAAETLGEEFIKENEGCLITNSYHEHTENEKLGNLSVYSDNSVMVSSIKNSKAYKEAKLQMEVVRKQTPAEIVRETGEAIMDILFNSLNAEDTETVNQYLASLEKDSEDWNN